MGSSEISSSICTNNECARSSARAHLPLGCDHREPAEGGEAEPLGLPSPASGRAADKGGCSEQQGLQGPGDTPNLSQQLFKTLVSTHCLSSIWSQRDNRVCKYLALTICDTITYTNTVANCVIVTCLRDPSLTAQDRARVVELWIQVAEGELSSLKKWCRREQHVSRKLLLKEATAVLETAERACQGAQERQRQQGVLPSLVTFFSSLELLDAAMEDYVECPAGFPQPCVHPVLPLAQEFKLMEEIELLQEATSLYTLQPVEHFGAWFQAVEPLSEEKSYSLSCQLEP
nr:PREDICTED: ral guanine nucleotide dissociation stimulator-like [Equus przewalskii]XP_023479263.1 ral guanine nucleotide dissociation stimulator [Equus caballus]